MNIGIDISPLASPIRTGVGEYTYELLKALFDIDTQNQYFLFYNAFRDVSQYIPNWKNKNIQYIKTNWPNKIIHASIQLFKFPQEDILIERKSGIKLDCLFSPNIGFQAISSCTKHIITVHDLSFEIFPECFSPKMRFWHKFLAPKKQCERADCILVPSENTKRDIQDIYNIPAEKIQVLSLGLSPAFFQPVHDVKKNLVKEKYHLPEKYILFLGTIEPRKNIEGILQAFELFQKKNGNEYKLVIAGGRGWWKNNKLLDMIEKSKDVQYIGYVESADKPALYAQAGVFVYPSLYEGFGFPVLESMACGIPVITSSRSSLPEIADDAAYFVNPYNTFEIAQGMERILTKTDVHNFYVQKGLKQSHKFQWQKTAQQFLSYLV